MAYDYKLASVSQHEKSIVCMGADPDPAKIPATIKSPLTFYKEILNAVKSSNQSLGAVKPNYAFWAQYGDIGLKELHRFIDFAKTLGYPVILDGKRADIGNTSAAYANEVFDFWEADAATVPPYMGTDSVMPFIEKAAKNNKGVYILTRTSNSGAEDFQDLILEDGRPNYIAVAEKVAEWGKDYNGTVGAVTGATFIDELEIISTCFVESGTTVPLLIPGVGAQGGQAWECTERLLNTNNRMWKHRINNSRGLSYAYEKLGMKPSHFAEASVIALKAMNDEITETLKKYNVKL